MVTRVAVTTGAPASAAAFTPTLPSHAAGDRLVLVVTGKYNTTTIPTINQGWTLVKSGTGGTGATGNDVGQMFFAVYAKDAASGAETAPTVTPGATAPNSWEWICATHRIGAGAVGWLDAIGANVAWVQSASDTTTASPLTGTAGAWTGVQPTAGDAIFAVGAIPTDLGSALGTTTITATGLTGGTKTTATTQYIENALGTDTAAVWAGWTGFTGTATAGLAMSFTVTGATNQSGALIAIAMREEPTPPFAAHPSAVLSPAAVKSTGSVLSTSAVDPPARVAVVVGFTSDATNNSGTAPAISSSAGTDMTWTLVAGSGWNGAPNNTGDTGVVALWKGLLVNPDQNLSSLSVTVAPGSGSINSKMLIARIYDDTQVDIANPIGAVSVVAFGASSTSVSASITPQTTGGGVRGLSLDWNATGIPTSFLPNNTDTGLVDGYHVDGQSTNVQIAKNVQTVAGVSQTIGFNKGSGSDGSFIAYELRAPVTGTNYPRSTSESVVVTDTVVRSETNMVRAVDDAAVNGDVLARTSGRARAQAESVVVTDAVAGQKGRLRSQSESVPVTDTVARSPQALVRSTAETRSVTDTVARASTRQRSAGETAAVGEATTPTVTRGRAVGDVADVSDDVVRAAQPLARGVADSAAVSEIVGTEATFSRGLADSASATDTSAAGVARGRSTSDDASVDDTTAQTASRARALAESRPVTDATVRRVARPRSQTEADPPVTDAVVRSAYSRSRALAEDAAVTDTVSASTTGQLQRTVSETREVTDTVARTAGVKQRAQAETRSVSDTVARLAPKTRALAETEPPVVDTTSRGTSRSRAVSDATLALDTSAIGVHRARATSEAAETSETVASVFSMTRGVFEGAALADLVARGLVQAREVLEALEVTDTVVFTYGEPPEYDLVVAPAVETFRVAAAAVPFSVSAVADTVDDSGTARPDYGVTSALPTYTVRSPR